MWFFKILASSVGKKFLMALSGLCLGLFLLVHALGNSSIFWGREAFVAYAAHLHGLGPLVPVFEVLLLAVFLVHVVTGIILFVENNGARERRYLIKRSAGGRTPGSSTMIYSGAFTLLFIVVHLRGVHFVDHDRAIGEIVAGVLGSPLYAGFYCVALLILGLHLSHGLWSMLQTAGFNHPRYDVGLRLGAWLLGGLVVAVFLAITWLLGAAGGFPG